jgi:surface antigen
MEKLLKEITNEENIQNTVEFCIKILENIIGLKIENGNKEIPEIHIFENLLNTNKYYLDNYQIYKEKLNSLKKGKISIKQEKNELEMGEKEDISSIFNKNDNSFIERDRNKTEDYLNEIQKCIPEKDLIEFRKCKEYIYKQISNFEKEEKNNFVDTLKWTKNPKKYKKEINNINNIGKIYAFFNHLNKHYIGFDIHTIQLISLLILSKKKISNKMKGVFCKINTGEGKSTIIQFFAAYKVLCGNKVDIVSSSPVLAERDARDTNKKLFYDQLNITVGAVTDEDAYSRDIVYGDTTQFSADILLQDYEFIRKRGPRLFDVVIIDEVDSMCIDNLGTKTQLTKKFPGYQSLYTFYYVIIYVFNFIAFEMKLTNNKRDIEGKRDVIKKAVLQRLMGNSFFLDNKDEDGVMREVDKYLLEEKKNEKRLNKSFSNESESDEDEDANLKKKYKNL